MHPIHKKFAIAGANLLALTVSGADPTRLAPIYSSENPHAQSMSEGELRQSEASHLEVFAGCKWGHAAFDPVQVYAEPLTAEVSQLYAELA